MLPKVSFVLDGDKLGPEQLADLSELDHKLYKNGCEVLLFSRVQPKPDSAKFLYDCKAVRWYWPQQKQVNVQPLQKALICAAGKYVVFTSVNNIISASSHIAGEVMGKNALIVCRLNQDVPAVLRKIGLRDISASPYIAIEKRSSQNVGYDGNGFDFRKAVAAADRSAEITFVNGYLKGTSPFLNSRMIFFRPYVQIIRRFIRKLIRTLIIRLRPLPKRMIFNTRDRIRLSRIKPITYSADIPVFIITRDRVEPLKKLVAWIENEGLTNIIFVDNNSSYPPLLDYFDKTPYEVVRLVANIGHKSPWSEGVIAVYAQGRPYIVSDPDIIPDKDAHGCVKEFVNLLNKYRQYVKVGMALRIDDLPDHFELKQNVIDWESQFWEKEIESQVYDAPVDTTFALYRANTPHTIQPALRTGRFRAQHEPWYIDSKKPDKEVVYYREHVDKIVGTWGLKKGDLSEFYLEYAKSKKNQ